MENEYTDFGVSSGRQAVLVKGVGPRVSGTVLVGIDDMSAANELASWSRKVLICANNFSVPRI